MDVLDTVPLGQEPRIHRAAHPDTGNVKPAIELFAARRQGLQRLTTKSTSAVPQKDNQRGTFLTQLPQSGPAMTLRLIEGFRPRQFWCVFFHE